MSQQQAINRATINAPKVSFEMIPHQKGKKKSKRKIVIFIQEFYLSNYIMMHQFSFAKMILNIGRYKNWKQLREGTHGIVYKAYDQVQECWVAIKQVKIPEESVGVPQLAIREISILRQLQFHPNIVKLKEVEYFPTERKLYLTFQHAKCDLKDYLSKYESTITPYHIKLIMFQLCNGLKACHFRNLLHRDLKPRNLLITHTGALKIADFGLSRPFCRFYGQKKQLTPQIQTLFYKAPEIMLGQDQYDSSVDNWSVGCIFAELVDKKPLFYCDSQLELLHKIFNLFGAPDRTQWNKIQKLPNYYQQAFSKYKGQNLQNCFKNFDQYGLDLCLQLLQPLPKKRISMDQALQHPYFNQIWQKI